MIITLMKEMAGIHGGGMKLNNMETLTVAQLIIFLNACCVKASRQQKTKTAIHFAQLAGGVEDAYEVYRQAELDHKSQDVV